MATARLKYNGSIGVGLNYTSGYGGLTVVGINNQTSSYLTLSESFRFGASAGKHALTAVEWGDGANGDFNRVSIIAYLNG
jgi:hypothetical protein